MELFDTVKGLQLALARDRYSGLTIGFVPTMGALHQGHRSLIERAGRENDIVVVSIFVNPNQFNDPNDLKNYPRKEEEDRKLLAKLPCDYLFLPEVDEVYPEPDTRVFDFGTLETVMEGQFRPGHFNGVAQVVSRLFEIVGPDRSYFGLKDFQQYSIIRNMVSMLGLRVKIVACDTVREEDGLAMSSRNALLTKDHRVAAPQIYRILQEAQKRAGSLTLDEVKRYVTDEIISNGLFRLEYFEIVDEMTLKPVTSWEEEGTKVGCIAVFAGSVRLIDNIVFDK